MEEEEEEEGWEEGRGQEGEGGQPCATVTLLLSPLSSNPLTLSIVHILRIVQMEVRSGQVRSGQEGQVFVSSTRSPLQFSVRM